VHWQVSKYRDSLGHQRVDIHYCRPVQMMAQTMTPAQTKTMMQTRLCHRTQLKQITMQVIDDFYSLKNPPFLYPN
jgi:hypothetical protein